MWLANSSCNTARILFLLTHPVWDVTSYREGWSSCIKFLLTHPVWDVTVVCGNADYACINFYSHIPCGMWRCRYRIKWRGFQFLLTHPVWDVTISNLFYLSVRYISTHTSRVGCDGFATISTATESDHFYSHIPCGMWQTIHYGVMVVFRFLLTHPVWDVT